jgi:hypothetical protein
VDFTLAVLVCFEVVKSVRPNKLPDLRMGADVKMVVLSK